jgi:hypothetical protein
MFLFSLATSGLLRLGIWPKVAKVLGPVIVVGLIALAIYLLVAKILGNAYDKGAADNDAIWNQASEDLVDRADNASDAADDRADDRLRNFTNQLVIEKERIDDAQANGSSPLDVLFPAGVR